MPRLSYLTFQPGQDLGAERERERSVTTGGVILVFIIIHILTTPGEGSFIRAQVKVVKHHLLFFILNPGSAKMTGQSVRMTGLHIEVETLS